MIALLLLAQAAPAPPPAREPLDIAPASLVTTIALDAGGQPTACDTKAAGMAGSADGCLLFARPDLLARWLGRPLTGIASVAVRLDSRPVDMAEAPPVPGSITRQLAAAAIAVAPDGTVSHCTAEPGGSFDLCRLLPGGGAAFKPAPGSGERRLLVSFTITAVPR